MPTPILRIPIDDTAFKRYLDTFQKYQDQLKAQPEMWQGINAEISGLALAGAAVAAEVAHQAEETRKLVEEERKRAEAQKEAAREKEASDKGEAGRDKEAAARRKHAIDQVKEYARSLAEAAVNLGKWALVGEGMALAGGVLGFWGLDKFVSSVGEERRLSQGLGVSMGQRQGMALNMQRYFDVNSTLETVANMQGTPADWGVFRMMGVDPNEDPAKLSGDMALAARRMFLEDNGNLTLAKAQGLTQVFSPDDLRRLTAPGTSEADILKSIDDSQKFAAKAGLRDDVGRKWQNFLINVDTAGLALKNKLVDRLTTLEVPLQNVMGAFTDLALRVLTKANLDSMAQGIEAFAKYIGSPKFQKDFQTVVDDIGTFASKLVSVLELLNKIPDKTEVVSAAAGAVAGGVIAGPAGAVVGALVGGGAAMAYHYNKKMGAQAEIASQLSAQGWTPAQQTGLLANMEDESSFNPFKTGDSGLAYGLEQWHPDRQAYYTKMFGHTMQSVTDPSQAISEQLKFMNWELNNTEKRAGDKLRSDTTGFDATRDVAKDYLRPKGGSLAALARAMKPRVEITVNNQSGASVATSANTAAGG